MGFRRTTASAKVFRIPVEINVTKGETMAMSAFDTHKAVKALSSAGFDNAQAEAVVDQISGAVSENVATKVDLERFATKVDLERFATKEDLRQEVEKLELRLAAELEKQSSKYLRSMVVVVAGIVGLSKALEVLLA